MTEADLLQEYHPCPACYAETTYEETLIGFLGKRAHHRCPACGWQWSEVDEDAIETLIMEG